MYEIEHLVPYLIKSDGFDRINSGNNECWNISNGSDDNECQHVIPNDMQPIKKDGDTIHIIIFGIEWNEVEILL